MKRKNWSSFIVTYGLSLLIATLILQPIAHAATVWSDDFDDGNYDGWTIHEGTFSADNYALEQTTEWEIGEGQTELEYSSISHSSEIVIGSWSFDISFSRFDAGTTRIDLLCAPARGLFELFFITNNTNAEEMFGYSFVIRGLKYSYDTPFSWSFRLACITNGRIENYSTDAKSYLFHTGSRCRLCWTSIEITRYDSGLMQVSVNGTKRIEMINTDIESSNYFVYSSHMPSAIDNVMIDDEPFPTTTTTTTTPTPTPSPTPSETTPPPPIPSELLAVGIGVPVILVIVLVVWKVRK